MNSLDIDILRIRMKNFKAPTILLSLALLLCVGCAVGGVNRTTTGAVGGAGLGAGLGAIIGNQTGNAGAGVAIGSAAGALGGALIGNQLDANDQANSESRKRIEDQQARLEENHRLITELKKTGADVTQTSRGVIVNLPDVLFQFNSSRLTGDAQGTLGEISEVIRDLPGRQISVEGHTDSIGTTSYNKRLSVRRASSVADGLRTRGVSGERLRVAGYGEGSPIATNNSEAGRARNRRVEIVIENQQRL